MPVLPVNGKNVNNASLNKKANNHNMGSFLTSDECEYGYIPISKNASKITRRYVSTKLGWSWKYAKGHFNNTEDKKFIVILRNPVDRWISGITEHIVRFYGFMDVKNIDFFINKKILDEHTEPQTSFLEGLDLSKCVFFKLNASLLENLDDFAKHNVKGYKDVPKVSDITHVDSKKELKNQMKIRIRNLLQEKNCTDLIAQFYMKDCELFNNTKYYEKS